VAVAPPAVAPAATTAAAAAPGGGWGCGGVFGTRFGLLAGLGRVGRRWSFAGAPAEDAALGLRTAPGRSGRRVRGRAGRRARGLAAACTSTASPSAGALLAGLLLLTRGGP